MQKIQYLFIILFLTACTLVTAQSDTAMYHEQYRPQIHFSPKEGWMNDPNGMVYYDHQYHLFFQYYPNSSIWGPMHWGHATSKDLVHWQQQPIALYPDSIGYIFSGSAVVDSNNTSGFGKDGKVPLVAIFTHSNIVGEKAGRDDFQNQSIAYSLDGGMKWMKYKNNPVIKNPGIKDFRDPKVSWFEEGKKWIMTLAAFDRVTFFSSPDLKNWNKESDFGATVGKHGAAWECPDLISFDYNSQKIWVLLVSINPGGPNGGSATQYFIGQFDGKNFTSSQTDTRWIDYGTDDYAGVTWSNTGKRKIFLGWMSNWNYAKQVPTEIWRSAMTVPRDLGIEKVGDQYFVTSQPVKELENLVSKKVTDGNISARNYDLTNKIGKHSGPMEIQFTSDTIKTFSVTLSNAKGDKLIVGYNKEANYYYIDRSKSGKVYIEKTFAGEGFHFAPRISDKPDLSFTLIIDNTSIEMFADGGLTTMTDIFFPQQLLDRVRIQSSDNLVIKSLQVSSLKSIWK